MDYETNLHSPAAERLMRSNPDKGHGGNHSGHMASTGEYEMKDGQRGNDYEKIFQETQKYDRARLATDRAPKRLGS